MLPQDAAVPPQREAALLQPGEAAGGLQAVGLVHPLGLAPHPRTRQGQAAVDGGINHKTYISILELATNLRFGEVFMLNGHLNIIKVDMKFVG